jgi:hypothetical protein
MPVNTLAGLFADPDCAGWEEGNTPAPDSEPGDHKRRKE